MNCQHACCLKVDQNVSEIHYVYKTIPRSGYTIICPASWIPLVLFECGGILLSQPKNETVRDVIMAQMMSGRPHAVLSRIQMQQTATKYWENVRGPVLSRLFFVRLSATHFNLLFQRISAYVWLLLCSKYWRPTHQRRLLINKCAWRLLLCHHQLLLFIGEA